MLQSVDVGDPDRLNLPDFWKLPRVEWKNITKHDFRDLVNTLNNSKSDAHRAYSNDIKVLMGSARNGSNT
ncbi:hypothetical protein VTP01DRAFT_7637 [Rhizomucor pusillus]|uniref:uncharacterized protein n=1 Tax=Rhizomucor pusillus TaxID=4840 RepID=UPI003741F758